MTARTVEQPRLTEVQERGWRQGFTNLLSKEAGAWWSTRTWWVQALVWLGLLDGFLAIPLWLQRAELARQPEHYLPQAYSIFFGLSTLIPAIGAVVLAQSAIIGERQLGTAAWILSKPVSRAAFILSKFLALGSGLLVSALVLPVLAAYLQLSLAAGALLPVAGFLGALGLLFVHLLFYLALTLMLGTFFQARGPVLAVPLALLLGAQLLLSLAPGLRHVTPWLLSGMAGQVAQGQPLGDAGAVLATLGWTCVFIGLAVWRFGREEF